jgi:NTP pyrophosphatase (non-canonical NTP hydrolase)
MSYLEEDSIDWQAVEAIDRWLDAYAGQLYQDQPLGQDWARLGKVIEELGEVIQAIIGLTGQNPRKGVTNGKDEVLSELADVAFTAIFCLQHFTKDTQEVRDILRGKLSRIKTRVPHASSAGHPSHVADTEPSRAAQFRETGVWPPREAGVRPPDSEHGLHP